MKNFILGLSTILMLSESTILGTDQSFDDDLIKAFGRSIFIFPYPKDDLITQAFGKSIFIFPSPEDTEDTLALDTEDFYEHNTISTIISVLHNIGIESDYTDFL